MGDSFKDTVDATSIQKGIEERETIIDRFNRLGILDRDDAIRKILELRYTDGEVLAITAGNMIAGGSTSFSACPDSKLVGELQMQVDILKAKLIKIAEENLSPGDGGSFN